MRQPYQCCDPRSVTSIGTEAFVNCSSLTAITVDTSNSVFSSVNGVLFNKSQTTLIQYPGGAAGTYVVPNIVTSIGAEAFVYHGTLTSVAISKTATSIGWDAFAFCSSLTSINIGNSVTSIESYAFYDGTNLNGVYFNGNAPNLGEYVFAYDNNATVYYLPGTTGWGPVFAGRPTALWKPQVQTSDASFGVRSNQFTFKINWASDMVVVVEACTNLANPTWSALGTNTIIGGSSYFERSTVDELPQPFLSPSVTVMHSRGVPVNG